MIADDIHATNRDFVRQKAVKRLTEQLLPQRAADGALIVGKLHVYTEKVLGKGSGGTVVYEGKLDGRRVAVKRLLREFYSMAKQEIELLVAADEQKNVVRYYAHEADTQVSFFFFFSRSIKRKQKKKKIVCIFSIGLCSTNVGRSIRSQFAVHGTARSIENSKRYL